MAHPFYCLASLAVGIGVNLLSIFVIYTVFDELGAPVSFVDCLILVPFPLLLSLLPLSIGGWGVREGALVVAFGLISVAPEVTLSTSVIFGLVLLVSSLPGGLLLALPGARTRPAAEVQAEGRSPAE